MHEVKNDKIDYHHAREFALKHLKMQAGHVPGLDIYNPDEESLRRAHKAFNIEYAKSHTHVKKQHLTKMAFDDFKHHLTRMSATSTARSCILVFTSQDLAQGFIIPSIVAA